MDDLFATELPEPLAGVDEVGRGPLAGPVVACAVILDPRRPIAGLKDSKALAAAARGRLASEIRDKALAWSLGQASVGEIDELNILQATMLAMRRAVAGLAVRPRFVLVDGNRTPDFGIPSAFVVKGDAKVGAISAASIVAKVYRDALMADAARQYPGYGFERHAGYGTAEHLAALRRLGATPLHRRSFRPVADAIGIGKDKGKDKDDGRDAAQLF